MLLQLAPGKPLQLPLLAVTTGATLALVDQSTPAAPTNEGSMACTVPAVKLPNTIAALAADMNADVVALGTAARKGVRKILFGNTAEDVVGRVACDVLTVKTPEE